LILPFERPQSDLQRAIQQRAQDALDRDAELDREKRRPQPLKWLTIFALACIPVLLTFVAVDGFLKVFHKVAAMYSDESTQQQAAPPEDTASGSQPGIVMLESYDAPSATQRSAPADSSSPPSQTSPPPR
jgi:cytoskeletal protein RodZ